MKKFKKDKNKVLEEMKKSNAKIHGINVSDVAHILDNSSKIFVPNAYNEYNRGKQQCYCGHKVFQHLEDGTGRCDFCSCLGVIDS